jgi:hypothetical protein
MSSNRQEMLQLLENGTLHNKLQGTQGKGVGYEHLVSIDVGNDDCVDSQSLETRPG